ncbi:MAG TPA: hypothetical protein VIX89_10295 [Bryobacteraceae bacterium]
MALQIIANQRKGPLPITISFKAPSDGPCCLIVSGSVWSQVANQTIGIQVALDNAHVGTASLFSNATGTHRAVVPTYIPVKLKFGDHQVVLSALPGTVSDINDYFDIVIDY